MRRQVRVDVDTHDSGLQFTAGVSQVLMWLILVDPFRTLAFWLGPQYEATCSLQVLCMVSAVRACISKEGAQWRAPCVSFIPLKYPKHPTIAACPSPPLPTWHVAHVAVAQPPIYITGDPVITCQGRHPQSPGLQGWRTWQCSTGLLKSCPCLLASLSLATKLGVGSVGVG